MGFSLDMDMNDLGQELKKLLGKKSSGASAEEAKAKKPKKDEIKGESSAARQARDVIIAVIFILSVSVAYVFMYYLPRQEAIEQKIEKLKEVTEKESQIPSLTDQISNRGQFLEESKERYAKILTYFDKSEELEDLYKSVSDLAISHKLAVINIHAKEKPKEKPKPVAAPVTAADGTVTTPPPPPEKKYKDNLVYIELDGKYNNYMKFKDALLGVKQLLTIHNESVEVIKDKSSSISVKVKINLSTYTIDKEDYKKAIEGNV